MFFSAAQTWQTICRVLQRCKLTQTIHKHVWSTCNSSVSNSPVPATLPFAEATPITWGNPSLSLKGPFRLECCPQAQGRSTATFQVKGRQRSPLFFFFNLLHG